MTTLLEFPGIGAPRDAIAPGLRADPVGSHVLFYRMLDDGRKRERP